MSKIKILVVEDETIVALDIKRALLKLDFEVAKTVTNYNSAIQSVKEDTPDLILMDINLVNSKDGIETAQDIQKIKKIPILYLTAFSDDETLCRAIQTNPIGYLIKPFKREELKSTILLGLYKIKQSNSFTRKKELINLGKDYYFDMKNEILIFKEMEIKLNINEKKLLNILIKAKGNVVSFIELENSIWTEYSVSDSALRTLLYRLRAKFDYKLIETIPTIGCKLNIID